MLTNDGKRREKQYYLEKTKNNADNFKVVAVMHRSMNLRSVP